MCISASRFYLPYNISESIISTKHFFDSFAYSIIHAKPIDKFSDSLGRKDYKNLLKFGAGPKDYSFSGGFLGYIYIRLVRAHIRIIGVRVGLRAPLNGGASVISNTPP